MPSVRRPNNVRINHALPSRQVPQDDSRDAILVSLVHFKNQIGEPFVLSNTTG
jgi:hypothetical protein